MAVIRIALPLVVVMCCVLLQSTSALIHVVGGTAGWGVPPNATFYTDWAKPRTFGAGDKLGQFFSKKKILVFVCEIFFLYIK